MKLGNVPLLVLLVIALLHCCFAAPSTLNKRLSSAKNCGGHQSRINDEVSTVRDLARNVITLLGNIKRMLYHSVHEQLSRADKLKFFYFMSSLEHILFGYELNVEYDAWSIFDYEHYDQMFSESYPVLYDKFNNLYSVGQSNAPIECGTSGIEEFEEISTPSGPKYTGFDRFVGKKFKKRDTIPCRDPVSMQASTLEFDEIEDNDITDAIILCDVMPGQWMGKEIRSEMTTAQHLLENFPATTLMQASFTFSRLGSLQPQQMEKDGSGKIADDIDELDILAMNRGKTATFRNPKSLTFFAIVAYFIENGYILGRIKSARDKDYIENISFTSVQMFGGDECNNIEDLDLTDLMVYFTGED